MQIVNMVMDAFKQAGETGGVGLDLLARNALFHAALEGQSRATAAVTNEGYYESAYADEVKQSDDIDKFPTLIYDGPFSESSEKREAKGLGTDEVDRETARATAEKLTGSSASILCNRSESSPI